MTVRNSGFVGARTSKLVEVVSLFKDCLKISLTHESSSKAGFTLENATKLELYGPDDEIQSFFNNGPVVGFSVTEFEDSKMRMIKRGVEFIGNAQRADGVTWQRESYRAYVDLRLRALLSGINFVNLDISL